MKADTADQWRDELKAQLTLHPDADLYICVNKDAGPDEQEMDILDVSFESRRGRTGRGGEVDQIVIEVSLR